MKKEALIFGLVIIALLGFSSGVLCSNYKKVQEEAESRNAAIEATGSTPAVVDLTGPSPGWTEEVLMGLFDNGNDLAIRVATGGCTKKEDFWIWCTYDEESKSGPPHYVLTIYRMKKDECKAFHPSGVLIEFNLRKKLGLPDLFTYTVTNRVGSSLCLNVSSDKLVVTPKSVVSHKKGETALSNSYFTASLPEGWTQEVRRGADSQVFLIELKKITDVKIPAFIYLRFYPNNSDFSDYQSFIEANSKNIFGETSTSKEQYGPVKKMTLNGREAFYLTKDYKHYLNLNKKSDEFVKIKNINIVIPSNNSFYVLTYRSEESDSDKYFDVFNEIVKSFKPLKNSTN